MAFNVLPQHDLIDGEKKRPSIYTILLAICACQIYNRASVEIVRSTRERAKNIDKSALVRMNKKKVHHRVRFR